MKYRNTKTGAIFEAASECKGEFVEALTPPQALPDAEEPKKVAPKRSKTKGKE